MSSYGTKPHIASDEMSAVGESRHPAVLVRYPTDTEPAITSRGPWRWGEPHEAPRVHHAGRQLSSGVAVCSARAAAVDASSRIP